MRANPTEQHTVADEPPTELAHDIEPDDDERLLGRYLLKKQLGSGAFGTVWLARDERLDRDVAVKSLPRDRVIHQRFEREARAAARLQHPAIVTLYEAAVDDDGAYLVSELVRGRTLDVALEAGRFSDRDILTIGIAISEALAHAHEQGVIHRDVKPSNILIPNRAGTASRAKLTDFGVAQVVGSGSLTRAGDVIGTLAYMSPEQADGEEVTGAADLYALAVVLYEALCGVNPLSERTLFGRAARHRTPFIPPLRRQRRDLPKPLAAAIDRALSPHPLDRGTLDDLHFALSSSLELVGDTPGIVAPGWHGSEDPTALEQEPGPEWGGAGPGSGRADAQTVLDPAHWREDAGRSGGRHGERSDAVPDDAPRRLYRRAPISRESLPEWLPRAAAAAGAGIATALLSTHLLTTTPLAPATFGLISAAAVLLLPRVGALAAVLALAGLAVSQGHTGAGLLLAAVAVPPMMLIWLGGEVLALPALAPLLGFLGLAGAFPALAGRRTFSWYQRAVIGAAGYIWMLYASALARQVLYWWPQQLSGSAAARAAMAGVPSGTPPPLRAWVGSGHATYDVLIAPLAHAPGLAGAAVWALAVAILPLLVTRRWPLLDLALAALWSVALVVIMQTVTHHDLHAAMLGGLVGFLIAAWPALTALLGGLRYGAPRGEAGPRAPFARE